MADLVAEDVFVARRALESTNSRTRPPFASTTAFSTDVDHDLAIDPLKRVQLSLQSVSALLPTDVITWNNIFVQLNVAQTAGFDVVHPVIEVVIDDPAALDQLRRGQGLRFSVGIGPTPVTATIPASICELKVGSLDLELIGASATGSALLWVQPLRSLGHGPATDPDGSEPSRHRVPALLPARGSDSTSGPVPSR